MGAPKRRRCRLYPECYVLGWLVLLVILLLVAGSFDRIGWWKWLVVGAIGFRYVDLLAFHARLFLKQGALRLRSPRRTLVLEVINLAEVAVAVAIVAVVETGRSVPGALADGFEVVTLRGPIEGAGAVLRLAEGLGVAMALAVVAGALAMVVGVMSGEVADRRR